MLRKLSTLALAALGTLMVGANVSAGPMALQNTDYARGVVMVDVPDDRGLLYVNGEENPRRGRTHELRTELLETGQPTVFELCAAFRSGDELQVEERTITVLAGATTVVTFDGSKAVRVKLPPLPEGFDLLPPPRPLQAQGNGMDAGMRRQRGHGGRRTGESKRFRTQDRGPNREDATEAAASFAHDATPSTPINATGIRPTAQGRRTQIGPATNRRAGRTRSIYRGLRRLARAEELLEREAKAGQHIGAVENAVLRDLPHVRWVSVDFRRLGSRINEPDEPDPGREVLLAFPLHLLLGFADAPDLDRQVGNDRAMASSGKVSPGMRSQLMNETSGMRTRPILKRRGPSGPTATPRSFSSRNSHSQWRMSPARIASLVPMGFSTSTPSTSSQIRFRGDSSAAMTSFSRAVPGKGWKRMRSAGMSPSW